MIPPSARSCKTSRSQCTRVVNLSRVVFPSLCGSCGACVRLGLEIYSRRGRTPSNTAKEVVSLTLVFLEAFLRCGGFWVRIRQACMLLAGVLCSVFGTIKRFHYQRGWYRIPTSLPHPVVSHIGRAGVFVDVFKKAFLCGCSALQTPDYTPCPLPPLCLGSTEDRKTSNSLQYGSRSRSDCQAREKRSESPHKRRTGTKHGQHGRHVRVPALQCTVCGMRKRIVWPGGTLFVYPFLGVFFPGPDVVLVQV